MLYNRVERRGVTAMDEKKMAENILKPWDDSVNRNSKDSVFCDLFEQPEYLLQMC